jgi:exodeoxyribonuclease V alpha subunit
VAISNTYSSSLLTNPLCTLEGIVERVIFHNDENGFCVLRVKAIGFSDLTTVIGYASRVSPGEHLSARGIWIYNKEYGQQFQAKTLTLVPPSTIEGLEKYLGSGMIKGIGPVFASKLISAFGEKVFEIIEQDPNKLLTIEKIGSKRVELIKNGWHQTKTVREIMVFLQSHGVSTTKAVRIYKTYGDKAIETVQKNPYQLARDINGIGFKSADIIAGHLGIEKDSLIRARAGLSYLLNEKVNNGHCAYPKDQLINETSLFLKIDSSILISALNLELKSKDLIEDTISNQLCIYPIALHRTEINLAHLIVNLSHGNIPWKSPTRIEKIIKNVNQQLKIQLAPLQAQAVKMALTNKLSIITGGPGTGKSTLTKAIISFLLEQNVKISLCSPTGRAAKRLNECTGIEAKTIHRLLSYDHNSHCFKYNQENPLDTDFILIDEASMVDLQLAYSLFRAIPKHTAIVIMGDIDQLPSIGPGQFLSDLINCGILPVVKLSQIFRQSAQSKIIQVAHKINEGELPSLVSSKSDDFFFIEINEPEEGLSLIIDLIKNRLPQAYNFKSILDFQVLCPMQKGILGARNLNLEIQKALNPIPKIKIERFGNSYGLNDKVIITQNDYDKDIFNGDLGFIEEINLEEQTCSINLDDKTICFDFSELDIVQPAYTITVHKSQGSEYPVVILPIVAQHSMMLKRNLIYTGITRGKKLVIIVGQKKTFFNAIKSHQEEHRWTNLKYLLK